MVTGLAASIQVFSGRVIGLFIVDRKLLARPDVSHDRFHFLFETLRP
jgi:hypothetical protein